MGFRGGVKWALELRHASVPLREDAAFAGEGLPYPTLESYLALLWREKRAQLEATMAAENCARGLLVVSVQGTPGPAWTAALDRSRRAAGAPPVLGSALLAGEALFLDGVTAA